MASIENRSHFQVTVKNRDDLTKSFAHNSKPKAEQYFQSLEAQKFKPKLSRLDDNYIIRIRKIGLEDQVLKATSLEEANLIKSKLEVEHKQGLLIDYASAPASLENMTSMCMICAMRPSAGLLKPAATRLAAFLWSTCSRSAGTGMFECCCDMHTCAHKAWPSDSTKHSNRRANLIPIVAVCASRRMRKFPSKTSPTPLHLPKHIFPSTAC